MSGYLENLFNGDDENITPLTAGIGFNDGANKGFWRIQPRIPKRREGAGRWIEMGAEIRSALKVSGKVVAVVGRALGSAGSSDTVRMLIQGMADKGIPDGMYELLTKHVDLIGGTLTDEYLRSKGINPEAGGESLSSIESSPDLPNVEDLTPSPITEDDLRLVNDGINSPEGKQLSAYKETPEGRAVAELDNVTEADLAEGAQAVQKALGSSNDWTPTPDGGATMTMPNGAVISVGKNGGYNILDTKGYSAAASMYSPETAPGLEAGKTKALATFNRNPDGYVWKSAEDFGPGWEKRPFPNGGGVYMKDNDPRQSFDITEDDQGGFGVGFSGRNADLSEAAYNDGIENESFGTPEEVLSAAKDFLNRQSSGPDMDSAEIDPLEVMGDEAAAVRDSWRQRFPALASGDVDALSSPEGLDAMKTILNEAAIKNPDFYKSALDAINDPNTSGAEKLQNIADALPVRTGTNPDGSPLSYLDGNPNRETLISARGVLEAALYKAGIKTSSDDRFKRKADRLVKDAMAGKPAPDLDAVLNDIAEGDDEEDLLDDVTIDTIGEDLGPDVDTSEFDRPVIEKGPVDVSEIEPGDFVTDPETDELIKVEDIEFNDKGVARVSGTDREGIFREFNAAPGSSVRRTIHGEPGDTSIEDEPTAGPAVSTPTPAEIVPKKPTVPKNAKPATNENIEVGDTVWNKDGVEIGTVRKILEKGFDNYARDYTKAEVVDSDGKVSTAKFTEGVKYSKVPKPEKAIAPEKPVAPTKPAPIPEPVIVPDVPETPAVPEVPETPEDLTPPTKKAESLTPGDTIYNANGTSGTVNSVSNDNGKVTVNYTDSNGEAKSKRFLEGSDVDTKPVAAGPDREATGNPISEEQKQILEDLDSMDSGDPIEDADLRERLMSAYNEMQDGDFQDEGEIQDLIDEVNDYYLAKNPVKQSKPLPAVHNRDMKPAVRSESEMQATKGSGNKAKGTDANGDRIESQLEDDYPDGHYIADPDDDFTGGFITHRQTIDGGKARHEVIVKRTIGNQFLVVNRFTDLATGEVKDFISHDYRDTYSSIHGVTNGIEKMAQFFAGTLRPATGGGAKVNPGDKFTGDRAYFDFGGDWKRKMTYWRGKYSKMNRTLDDINKMKNKELKATYLDELKNKYNGDLNEMNAAHTLQDMRMLTLEEKIAISLDGESERQNTTTDIVVGNIQRSKVQSMIDAMKSSNRTDGRDRFQELMNLLPEDSAEAKKIVMSFLRQMLKEDLDKSGITGTQRTKALQKLSAIVTNYVKNADKKWSVENEMRFPHVSGSGIVVAKRGDKAEWTTNTGEKVVGVIVDLRRESGPRGNDDFVRMQFLDPKTGKLFTVPSDLAATNMRIVDPSTPVTPFENWKRNVPLAFERGGQEFADRRAKALAKRTEQRRIRLLGSDGEPQDDSSETVEVVPNGLTKQATQLLPGDTIYDTKGNAIGSVVKTKLTSAKGNPIVAVMYKDVNGNVQKIAYSPDQEIGPDAPKA